MGAVWMGYDKPKKLGDRETGGGLSLPIWINFMETALKTAPVAELPVPAGVVNVNGEWYYEENSRGSGISSLGINGRPASSSNGIASQAAPIQVLPPADERRRILDLFKN